MSQSLVAAKRTVATSNRARMLCISASLGALARSPPTSVSAVRVVRDPLLAQQCLGSRSRGRRSSSGGCSIRSTSGRSHVSASAEKTSRREHAERPSARACRGGCPRRDRVPGCAASCSRVIDPRATSASPRRVPARLRRRFHASSCSRRLGAGRRPTCRCGSGARSRRRTSDRARSPRDRVLRALGVDVDPLGAARVAQHPLSNVVRRTEPRRGRSRRRSP